MTPPTWDILIASLVHRTEQLTALLEALIPQLQDGVGVICYRDNRQVAYWDKVNALRTASEAEYICFVDDDDTVADDYVAAIMEALKKHPDEVGFRISFSLGGVPQKQCIHSSTVAQGWYETADAYYRDHSQFQPLRRELALKAPWQANWQADRHWADELRRLKLVKSEIFIDRILYSYRHSGGQPSYLSAPMPDPPPRLDFPAVRWIG